MIPTGIPINVTNSTIATIGTNISNPSPIADVLHK